MKDQKDKNSAYWKYLEENSKVVSEWPEWLKGDRASPSGASGDLGVSEQSTCEKKIVAS